MKPPPEAGQQPADRRARAARAPELALLALLLVGAGPVEVRYAPARPTVGDVVTLRFPGEVSLDPSADYELVSTRGGVATIRVFRPGKVRLAGQLGKGRFESLIVPVESVLRPDDSLQPAPLKPPLPLGPNRTARIALAIAAGAALLAWGALLLPRAPFRIDAAAAVSAEEEFRQRLAAIRKRYRGDIFLIELADATRGYLARSTPWLGRALTSSELLAALESSGASAPTTALVAEILADADRAKFSPWGAGEVDSLALSSRALEIARRS